MEWWHDKSPILRLPSPRPHSFAASPSPPQTPPWPCLARLMTRRPHTSNYLTRLSQSPAGDAILAPPE
ncbi:hypothetical protein E2C01_046996 [Portunus trituberculatus]|uniref:Uncharacterized protein n=1 Tax=Portunus trituberculatus TaxID=210409 RepID=A0A5B7G011_PORTR|nr:hypothetical protein [Portunus trituberculatus]